MSKMGTEDVFNGIMSSASSPAPKTVPNPAEASSAVEPPKEPTSKPKKKKATAENNLKRQTFWADQTQWDWIQDYSYTTRQTIMETMYQIIEEFQTSHEEMSLDSKPRRRRSKK